MSLDGVDPIRLRTALEKATAALLAERNVRGFWEGELSSSALSTATAVTALALAVEHGAVSKSEILNLKSQIAAGLRWLADHQNTDGGWGDTTKSLSNISTTTLGWAAFGACESDQQFTATLGRCEAWLRAHAGGIDPSRLAKTIIARYGKDRTFSVPILTMCALAGRLGSGPQTWRDVIPLPFELAALPHQLFAALRLPVVSYALPALIAIGLARHVHAPSRNPFTRAIRNLVREKVLRVLTEIQPSNGGFLEATPLTSFVTMSLVASGLPQHAVAQRGIEFLLKSQREDGSWPIDTNLSTWCTTLAIEALPEAAIANSRSTIDWLLAQQYRVEHPYTHAAPGGWAWTDLPGGVPDADDTGGALVALAKLRSVKCGVRNEDIARAAEAGIRWLLDLQNRDGGIPTFCRGWGALPFDRSSADITAHTVRAFRAWQGSIAPGLLKRVLPSERKAVRFLLDAQRDDGGWEPLWFGNEHTPGEINIIYGTARVLCALAPPDPESPELSAVLRGARWLLKSQNADGGWGYASNGASSVEETALAMEALLGVSRSKLEGLPTEHRSEDLNEFLGRLNAAIRRGTQWLVESIETNAWREPSPIGFYFAKLWYFEKLYPIIFTVGALRSATNLPAREDL